MFPGCNWDNAVHNTSNEWSGTSDLNNKSIKSNIKRAGQARVTVVYAEAGELKVEGDT
jgi:hypothetical protein